MTEPEIVSKWFKLSDWTSKHRLATPVPPNLVENWRRIAHLLDAIRDGVGVPVTLTPNGGYRNPEHNRARGGKPNSRHLYADAADINARGMTSRQLHARILAMHQAALDRAEQSPLLTLGGLGLYAWGVHVDARPAVTLGVLARWDESKRGGQEA